MNHDQAMSMLAVERYSLDEMTPEDREAFEQHYFECSECWTAVRRAELFAQNARVAARTAARKAGDEPKRPFERRLLWLAPLAAAIAVVAILVPMRFGSEPFDDTRPMPSLTLIGPVRDAVEDNHLPADRRAILSTVVTPVEDAVSYRAELRAADGRLVQQWNIAVEETGDSFPLPVRPLSAGGYVLVIESVGSGGRRSEITRYPFTVVTEARPEKRNN